MKTNLIKKGPTLILKLTIIIIGISALLMCGLLIYLLFNSNDIGGYKPILLGMLLTAIPFFYGIIQAFKILIYIDENKAFSDLSVKALKKIKNNAFIISGFYILCMPYIYYVAENDDAPGGILIGMILVVAPAIVGIIALTLQKLLFNAIEIKSENDLTV